ncbi:MAG: 16S rRNA (guanine(966)-N(2))-methyltransferase RsmD [Myxococcaceae bacterium]
MRIVAGTARGRPLEGPKSSHTIRPTADRVRETLFNVLGQWMEGLTVLDLYAGTGALALEAVSRGAVKAVLVDQDKEAVRLCRANALALGFGGQVEVIAAPVERALGQLQRAGRRFDLVFADPPYAARVVPGILEQVERAGVLAPGARLCIEHDKREEAPETHGGLTRVDQRPFGDTRVSFYAAA